MSYVDQLRGVIEEILLGKLGTYRIDDDSFDDDSDEDDDGGSEEDY